MSSPSKQTRNGKAFEYALLREFYHKLKRLTKVSILKNSATDYARECYESFDDEECGLFSLTASFAVNFLIDLEPRLSNRLDELDTLELEVLGDRQGEVGDVRDVIVIRSAQKWKIGVSAKNNHRAMKHSRISKNNNFGKKWMNVSCSKNYFDSILPIFEDLENRRSDSDGTATWQDIPRLHEDVYAPILEAFKKELELICQSKGAVIQLIQYLIGKQDYYKVIRLEQKAVEIQAYNLHGTLSQPFKTISPMLKIPQLSSPQKITQVSYKKNSQTTLLVEFDNGWIISFRIHSASSKVEASLKFDIQLMNTPKAVFTNTLTVW